MSTRSYKGKYHEIAYMLYSFSHQQLQPYYPKVIALHTEEQQLNPKPSTFIQAKKGRRNLAPKKKGENHKGKGKKKSRKQLKLVTTF